MTQLQDAPVKDATAITVFLLDDHEIVRDGIRVLLESAGLRVVGEAASAPEALRRVMAVRPQVAVLDIELQEGDGVSVCREIRAALPDTQVIMLTSHDDDEALFASIMAGASGYVLKQVRGNDLVEGIRRVAAGQSLLDPSVISAVLARLRQGPQEDPRLTGLTEQERRVLELIAEGMTNRQIGTRLHLAEKTVKNYVSSLLGKLGLASRTQAAVYITQAASGHADAQ